MNNRITSKEIAPALGKEIGEKIGEERGKEIGKDDAFVTAIKAIMKNERKTFEECCISMDIGEQDMMRYRTMI